MPDAAASSSHLPEPDLLSRLFDTVGTRGESYCRTEASGRWSLAFGVDSCHFHHVEQGRLWVRCGAHELLAVAGDLLILPQGLGHTLASDAGPPGPPNAAPIKEQCWRDVSLRLGGDGEPAARFVSGAFRFNDCGAVGLLRGLPTVLHLTAEQTAPLSWLETTLGFLALEAQHPSAGSAKMISCLIELMFIQAVRHWVHQQRDIAG